ncbi:putative major facilitator superfamily transporter [Erysiphe necator]|uniref:Putative major facilitator superfamily transporter n=1 Tax=Uncinula necator TaxID=52586 RepID=A0A0B1P496_UNCNE|nr:putative major facilitator superfamily transporter [Erysiphe necator]
MVIFGEKEKKKITLLAFYLKIYITMNKSPSKGDLKDERKRLNQFQTSDMRSEISFRNEELTTNNTKCERNIPVDESQTLLYCTNITQSTESIGEELQRNSKLTNTQVYGTITEEPRRLSSTSLERIDTAQNIGIELKSPYLAGVSVHRFWLIFTVNLISFFIAVFDTTIMISSHPVITSAFESSNSASWLSTAFLLTSTGFQPLFGGLSDAVGRKKPLLFCLSILSIATMWCALAQSMTSFIIARAFCGLGAGGLISLSSIVISDLVPIEIRSIYQSYINVAFGVGSASGAALGGWIADSLGWRWEFGIQIPTLVLCLCTAYIAIPSYLGLTEANKNKSLLQALKEFDYKGSILLTMTTTFLILGLNLGGNILPWKNVFVILSLIISIILFPYLIYVESHTERPILPPKIMFQNPRASIILISCLGSMIAYTIIFNIPIFFQAVMLESATSSGLRLLVPSVVTSAAGTLVGFLISWTKRMKVFLVIGILFSFVGSIAMSFLRRGWQAWVYLIFLVPTSFGQGFMITTIFMSILSVSLQTEQAVVSSTVVLWRSLGTVFGVSLSSLILQNILWVCLDQNVIGPEREEVIKAVRKSVTAIHDLKPLYQDQVRDSYTTALHFTFASAAVLSLICLLACVSLKIPRIGTNRNT